MIRLPGKRTATARAARHKNHAAAHPRPAVLTVDSSPLRRYVSRSGLRETPRWTNARRGALNAPQLLPPIPTFPAPVHRKSRAAILAAPRWAPVESFPAGPVPPIASVGERKPADGYFVARGRYVSRSGLRETPRWTNARRGALNAPQLLPPVPTFPAPVHRKSRAAFLAAPRWAPVESFPAGPVPPIASVGERKPADGYFVARGRYVPGSGLRKILAPDERPSRRIKRAATLASDSDVSSSGPPEKPRGLFGRAPLGSG
ncbi:MAG: hypothetical protein IPN90_00515 [Elusimicrobia bacterium]|nr:hypothetical protein [Elusimicrobiota bacterium]